ncbi:MULTISPECIES: hypothetical protein [unclassified Nostoc]|uniref:hypothetical protein n=1 Tax=unclassified Nostoc TaxID=2593658 RepID=UPI0025F5C405|nr:hypothetical protein [Nostoc sp. JL33]MBN3871668.1 hypothetical protein [Nostoc sp. JL33]
MGQTFLFGFELKALKVHPAFQVKINRDALAVSLRIQSIAEILAVSDATIA